MTPRNPVFGLIELIWDVIQMIADIADFSPLIAIAIAVALFLWLYSLARKASGAEVAR